VALLLPKLENRKLRWCTERRRLVVAFWLALAGAAIVCGRLLRRLDPLPLAGSLTPPPMTASWSGSRLERQDTGKAGWLLPLAPATRWSAWIPPAPSDHD